MRKGIVLTAVLLFIFYPCLDAQKKEISQARTYLKSGSNLDKAETLMKNLLEKDTTGKNRLNPKIYDTWYEAVKKQVEQGNEKLYLKQQYDTATLFNNTLRMFPISETLDSVDSRHRYRREHAGELNSCRPNLFYGGSFFMKKEKWSDAYHFFDTYLDCAREPLFASYDYSYKDPLMNEAAYWATYCAYKDSDAANVLKYADRAMRDSSKISFVMQYMAVAYLLQHDTAKTVDIMFKGVERYPAESFFFTWLSDYYNGKGQYDSALMLADRVLRSNPRSTLFLYARSTALLNLGRYDESLIMSDSCININDSLPDPYFNAAMALLNKALELEQVTNSPSWKKNNTRKRQSRNYLRGLYEQARPYMEQYRRLAPEEKNKWAPALYRIYLNLNLGNEFDEIDKILRN